MSFNTKYFLQNYCKIIIRFVENMWIIMYDNIYGYTAIMMKIQCWKYEVEFGGMLCLIMLQTA